MQDRGGGEQRGERPAGNARRDRPPRARAGPAPARSRRAPRASPAGRGASRRAARSAAAPRRAAPAPPAASASFTASGEASRHDEPRERTLASNPARARAARQRASSSGAQRIRTRGSVLPDTGGSLAPGRYRRNGAVRRSRRCVRGAVAVAPPARPGPSRRCSWQHRAYDARVTTLDADALELLRSRSGLSIDDEGRFLHLGEPITHARTLEVLWRSLARAPDGRWLVRVGRESAYVAVEETPYTVRGVANDASGAAPMLLLSDGTREVLDPAVAHDRRRRRPPLQGEGRRARALHPRGPGGARVHLRRRPPRDGTLCHHHRWDPLAHPCRAGLRPGATTCARDCPRRGGGDRPLPGLLSVARPRAPSYVVFTE